MDQLEPVPRTAIDRGPRGEEPLNLSDLQPEVLPEAGGDTSANELDSNVGGASATAGLDSGGAVGVRRGLAVGRPGAEYETAPNGEIGSDVVIPAETNVGAVDERTPEEREEEQEETEESEPLAT